MVAMIEWARRDAVAGAVPQTMEGPTRHALERASGAEALRAAPGLSAVLRDAAWQVGPGAVGAAVQPAVVRGAPDAALTLAQDGGAEARPEPPGLLERARDAVVDVFTSERRVTPEGRVVVESAEVLRWTVPGQVAWDEARSAYANDGLAEAGAHTAAMLAEVGLTVATAGTGKAALQGARVGVQGMDEIVTAAPAMAAEARSLSASVNRTIEIAARQLQRKFKHAEDFGVVGSYNPQNGSLFGQAIERHMQSGATRAVPGTYRGQSVTHFVNPETGLNVIRGADGQFVSGWRLGPEQLRSVLERGSLGGG